MQNRIINLKVGQSCFINGTINNIGSKIQYAKKYLPEGASFKTEAREGGRLVTRIA